MLHRDGNILDLLNPLRLLHPKGIVISDPMLFIRSPFEYYKIQAIKAIMVKRAKQMKVN